MHGHAHRDVIDLGEEACALPDVARGTIWMHLQQYGVTVAVDANGTQVMVFPLVSPFSHRVCLDRLKKVARRVRRVASHASRFMCATISTSDVVAS